MNLSLPNRTVVLGIAALTMTAALSACGSENDSTDTPAAPAATAGTEPSADASAGVEFNDADVTFAQMMIPHHEQAVAMAKLAAEKASDPEVKKLAADIEAAQGPEVEKMRSWLSAWGKSVEMDHAAHGSGPMAGMMSDAQVADLEKASTAEFDEMFLKLMIEHHRGAIEAARTEQVEGKNADAKAAAADVITDQSAEIERIEKLLAA